MKTILKQAILLLSLFMVACGSNNAPENGDTPSKESSDNLNADSIAVWEQYAIGTIEFFKPKSVVDKQVDDFLQACAYQDLHYSGVKLGDWKFNHIDTTFYNDSLYSVELFKKVTILKGDNDGTVGVLGSNMKSIVNVLSAKFGAPKVLNEIPLAVTDDIAYHPLYQWSIGKKRIIIVLDSKLEDSEFKLYSVVKFYRADFEDSVIKRNRAKSKQIEQEERQKAVDIL